jgi:hypothetical protein
MNRPVVGGLAQPYVNVALADGGVDFRTAHTARFARCWKDCRCQSCGDKIYPRAVLMGGPIQITTGRFTEPPLCPPCALYASRACPMVAGRMPAYADRKRVSHGRRGERCAEPGCDCGGWVVTDPEHSADIGGTPSHAYYAAFIRPDAYVITAHEIVTKCSDKGCEHERLVVNGAQLKRPPLKVVLVSEPGTGRVWRTLPAAEAAELTSRIPEHAREVLANERNAR